MKLVVNKTIDNLNIDSSIVDILNKNNIMFIKDLWKLNRKDLKNLKLSDNQVNQIIIKMQLNGIDLSNKTYH